MTTDVYPHRYEDIKSIIIEDKAGKLQAKIIDKDNNKFFEEDFLGVSIEDFPDEPFPKLQSGWDGFVSESLEKV